MFRSIRENTREGKDERKKEEKRDDTTIKNIRNHTGSCLWYYVTPQSNYNRMLRRSSLISIDFQYQYWSRENRIFFFRQ